MAKLYLTLLLAIVLAHATARNIPNKEAAPNQSTNAPAPVHSTENMSTTAGAPAANGATVNGQKNFLSYGGVGGFGGIGGYVGVLPVIGGIGVGGGGGLGGLGVGGLGGIGLGKVGGVGFGGGVGGVIP